MGNKLHGSIILTYRCNAKCNMCDVWHYPTKPAEEIGLDLIEKLPEMFFTNITGGRFLSGRICLRLSRSVRSTRIWVSRSVLRGCRRPMMP